MQPVENQCEGNKTLIGDGFCNDITNIPECDYDGGDCCGETVLTEYCDVCTCNFDPSNPN